MILNTAPELWNSVHRPIPFIYDHVGRNVTLSDSGGFLLMQPNIPWLYALTMEPGDKIFISGCTNEDYNTTHIVREVIDQFNILLETAYDGDDSGVALWIRLPEIKLYSGYATGEEYPDDLPLTLVATFTPENSPDNDIRFDVSEYLKSIFRIQPPELGIDFNMFNRFRLYFDGIYRETYQVLNSSIPTATLMSDFANTGNPLNAVFPPIVFGCGETIISYLENNVVTNVIGTEDEITVVQGDYYFGDYSAGDYYVNN